MTGRAETIWSTRSADETRAVGRAIGRSLEPGDVVLLYGDLGAGKTTLTKGIAEELGVAEELQSPTFTVMAEYPAPSLGSEGWLVHVDLYRLAGTGDIDSIGFDEVVERDDAVVVIEWPERAAQSIQASTLVVQIEGIDDARTISLLEPGQVIGR